MAEFVQQSIEEMIPELEQMERIGLFTSTETRSILKKRKSHEYKLRKKTKQKEDYLLYIQYEISVLNLVKRRRKKIGYHHKHLDIDVPIINRIHKLFKLACRRFADDVKLWLSHIEFCKKRKDKAPVGNLHVQMLQIHNRKPGLWVLAAQWEMEEGLSMENARGLLQRGIRFNPESQHLWQEYFRMELLNTDKVRKRREVLGLGGSDTEEATVPDSVLQGQVASVVFKKAMEKIPGDVEFCISFVPICHHFDFTKDLEDHIFEHLQANFSNEERAWEATALRPLQNVTRSNKKVNRKEREDEQMRIEEDAVQIFEEAVTHLNTEKMWKLYINFCMGRQEIKSSSQASRHRVERAAQVFQQAHNHFMLTADLYIQWAELLALSGDVLKCETVLEAGIKRYPSHVELRTARLQSLIDTGVPPGGMKAYIKECMDSVPAEECHSVLKLSLDWSTLCCPDYTEEVLEVCVAHKSTAVSTPMKEAYLEWASMYCDIHRVRKIYNRLKATKPLSLDFYKKYIAIESTLPSPKLKHLRQGYEDALQDYGSSQIDLWLDYIRLEHTHSMGTPEALGKIHWRALKTIDSELTDRFVAMYTLQQNNKL